MFNSLPIELPKSYPPEDAIISLICQYYENKTFFTEKQNFQIKSWYIQTYIIKELKKSDDSFHFSKVCQFIQTEFQVNLFEDTTSSNTETTQDVINSDSKNSNDSENTNNPIHFSDEIKKHRLEVILLCLKVCYQIYSRSRWAKQPVESLYLTVSQWRLQIPYNDYRERLDEINTKLIQLQRKLISGGGGSDVKTIRTYNSTAHPLKTKKIGILR